jgi:hypothetical protein
MAAGGVGGHLPSAPLRASPSREAPYLQLLLSHAVETLRAESTARQDSNPSIRAARRTTTAEVCGICPRRLVSQRRCGGVARTVGDETVASLVPAASLSARSRGPPRLVVPRASYIVDVAADAACAECTSLAPAGGEWSPAPLVGALASGAAFGYVGGLFFEQHRGDGASVLAPVR